MSALKAKNRPFHNMEIARWCMADAIRWEQVVCPACGGDEDEFLRAPGDDKTEYRLAKCRRCELVYTNPRPDVASIGQFYPADYVPYQPRELHKSGNLRGLRDRVFRRGERTLADRISVVPDGRLLDYGCGSGRFAAKMRDRGWNALGMDFSAHAANAARRNFGLTVIHGDLPHPDVPPGSLDAATLRAVLEHVHDPGRLLRAVFDALKPNGHLFVSVPNLAGWGFRTFGAAWFPLDLPRHLLHFTPDTLRRVVTDAGFVVDAIKTRGHVKWMGYSAERARKWRPRWWTPAARLRLVRSALTSWTEWLDHGDDLGVLARKPGAAIPTEAPVHRAA
jgi:SAM-dependent methyltransferase